MRDDAVSRALVLHVVTHLDFGGLERRMQLIAEHAALSRHAQGFVALGQGGATFAALQSLGAQVACLGSRVAIPSPQAVWRLRRLVQQLRPQILHLHGAEANFHGILAVAGLRQPPQIIVEEIGLPQHGARMRRVFRRLYRRAGARVAVSQAVAAQMVALGEAAPAEILVIHGAFALQRFRPLVEPAGRFQLGFVGRLEPVKNPMLLLEALALLQDQGVDLGLTLIGAGSLEPAITARISALALQDHVTLQGFDPAPFDHLEACQLYVQPSLHEGFGLALREAMSRGLPVLASAAGGTVEIIEDQVTGWLLHDLSAAALAARIRQIMALPLAARQAVALRANAEVRRRFAPETYLQALDQLYDGLLAGRGGT